MSIHDIVQATLAEKTHNEVAIMAIGKYLSPILKQRPEYYVKKMCLWIFHSRLFEMPMFPNNMENFRSLIQAYDSRLITVGEIMKFWLAINIPNYGNSNQAVFGKLGITGAFI
jgi:hypothetical protein